MISQTPYVPVSKKQLILLALATLGSFFLRVYLYHQIPHLEWSSLVFPDERNYYLAGAKLLLEQGWQYFLTERSMWNGPLCILPLALLGLEVGAVKVFHLLLLSLCGAAIWDICRRYFGILFAWLGFFGFLTYTPFYTFGPTILSEPLFTFLITATFWLCTAAKRSVSFVFAGGLLGFACLVRPTPQYFPIATLGLFLFLRKREFLAFALGSCLMIVPWVCKNTYFFGKASIATGSGAVFFLGNDFRKDGDEPIYSRFDFDTFELTKPYSHLDIQGDRILLHAAIDNVRGYPYDFTLLTIRKFFRLLVGSPASFFFPYPNLASYIQAKNYLLGGIKVYEILITISVAVLGLWYWSAAFGTGVAATLGAVLVWYFFLIHSVAFAIPRMLLPVSPILWVGAVGSMYSFLVLKRMRAMMLGLSFISLIVFGFMVSGDWTRQSDLVSTNSRKYFSSVREFNISEGTLHSLKITGEFLEVDGRNPYIEFQNLDIPLEKNQVLFLDIATSLSNRRTGKLRWATAEQSLLVDSMENFTLPSEPDRHTVRISPSLNSNWRGRMRKLRLRLSGPIGTRYQISAISFRK